MSVLIKIRAAPRRRTLPDVIAGDPRAAGPRLLLSHVLFREGRHWKVAGRPHRLVLAINPSSAERRPSLKLLLCRLGRAPMIA
jgi:hypothetical protein